MGDVNTGYKKVNKLGNGKMIKFISLLTLILIILMTSFAFTFKYIIDSNNTRLNEEGIVIDSENGIPIDIPIGAGTTDIANILKEKGIIKNPLLFKVISSLNGFDGTYKSGMHIVNDKLDYTKLMTILSGNPESIRVTIPEGNNISQIADALLKKKLINDKAKFISTINNSNFNYKFLQGLPKRDIKLEGYLFPDTYDFGLKVSEEEIIKAMVGNFDNKFLPKYFDQAKKLNMTIDQVITLASIIEKEARRDEERAIISGVFHNRLNSKDKTLRKLQSCATIQYMFLYRMSGVSEDVKQRILKGIIRNEDTKKDDPYNTYLYEGLPKGPISSPGAKSILAALYPEKNDFYYFVATGDGSSDFSKTLAEHEAKKKKYGLN
ncbi:MAG: hypothetical protein K0R31_1277 [Clostridiales bacterium]|nr:hypothetical protein [Clostridiales bacterium]